MRGFLSNACYIHILWVAGSQSSSLLPENGNVTSELGKGLFNLLIQFCTPTLGFSMTLQMAQIPDQALKGSPP